MSTTENDAAGHVLAVGDLAWSHEFLPSLNFRHTRCGYCMVEKADHGDPSPEVKAGAQALVDLWPGWLKDGGGIHARQDAQAAVTKVLDAIAKTAGATEEPASETEFPYRWQVGDAVRYVAPVMDGVPEAERPTGTIVRRYVDSSWMRGIHALYDVAWDKASNPLRSTTRYFGEAFAPAHAGRDEGSET